MRPHPLALTLGVVIALLAGCGFVTISGKGDMRTLTRQQAMQRVEEHIAAAVNALPVKPRLEEQSTTTGLPCADPTDLGPPGRVIEAKTYWLRELPFDHTKEFFDAMLSYWLSHGYRVLFDWRDRSGAPALFVENNSDAFRMSLETSVYGDLSISATSPCVWPNGTPPPDVARR